MVVVAIDERSVQRHGRWPWRRELLAEAVSRLDAARPAAIGLDITFTDQDPGSESAAMGEAAEALGRAVAGLPEPSRQPFTPVLAGLRARASGSGDAAAGPGADRTARSWCRACPRTGSAEAQDYLAQREDAEVDPRARAC